MLTHLSIDRICPGRHMSLDSLYAMISATLAIFDIAPPKDENGNTQTLKPTFSDGLLRCVHSSLLSYRGAIDNDWVFTL
jgi:hypothetical protein